MKSLIRFLLVTAVLLPVSLYAATIALTVTNSVGGAAIQGATVTVAAGTGTGAGAGGTCTTSAAGTCTLNATAVGTAIGARTVTVSMTGFTTNTGTVNITTANQAATRAVALVATATGATITGRVTNAVGGAAIAGAAVTLTGGATTTTNATGNYTFTGVTTGAKTITVTATGFTTNTGTTTVIATTTTVTVNIALTATSGGQVTFAAAELVRATDKSAKVAVVANSAIVARVKYGTQSGVYPNQTDSVAAAASAPLRVTLNGLASNTTYYYRLSYHAAGSSAWTDRTEYSFHTQRPAGSQFIFEVTTDDHLDGTASSMYDQTINCAAADHPDFLFDMGDWYTNAYYNTQGGADTNAIFMRKCLLPITPNAPVYLVNGNHEHEEGWFLTPNWASYRNVPIYAANARIKYFLNPAPDAFYSGDDSTYANLGVIEGGHRASYYSFVWGDALFVGIDPFFYTSKKPYSFSGQPGEPITTGDGDSWDWTLGPAQYAWLRNTLHNSTQKYKFVFTHQVTGDPAGTCNTGYGRGGVKAIDGGFEWGGGTNWNQAGSDWSIHRPASAGWIYGPIHQIFKDNGVTIFFHGHDHLYVYETRDGIVYQESPSPTTNLGALCTENYTGQTQAANPGYLRVTVSPGNTKVEYVHNTCSVAESYTVQPPTSVSPSHKTPTQPFLSLKNGILAYSLDQETPVEIRIYDLRGREIFETKRLQLPGSYTFSIENMNLPVKSYVIHFKAGTVMDRRIAVNENTAR